MPNDIETADSFNQVIKGTKPAIIRFWTTWSAPCATIKPKWDKLETETGKSVHFYDVEADEFKDIAALADAKEHYPQFQIYYKGDKIDTVVSSDITKVEAALKELHKKIKKHDA